jgi:hypothetical protein
MGASHAILATAGTFTTTHISVTAAISGGLALLAALLLDGRGSSALIESALIGLLTAAAVFLWRKSADTPPLNNDGINGFSPNDWLAPTLAFVLLSLYGNLHTTDARRFGRSVAAATMIAFVVNVITI